MNKSGTGYSCIQCTAMFLFMLLFSVATFEEGAIGYSYNVKTFQVPVDHFSFTRNDTFDIRYLVNDSYWDGKTGPIFFYTGNEGDIELFANNTGFMWEIAPIFKALIIFAEHRYYGQSLPFGNESLINQGFAGFLTSQQALADYVDLITFLRSNQTERKKSPVIAFGGSYGGMLAAYIRMKYSHLVAGAIASSAPIWQFTGLTPCDAFYKIATSVYKAENHTCSILVRRSWKALRNVTNQDSGLDWLSKNWKLCKPLEQNDVKDFKSWLENVYINLAMANYPYPANFLGELPGFPVRAFCKNLQNITAIKEHLLSDLFKAVSVYFNHTGKAKCLDWQNNSQIHLGEEAWDFQSCTEMIMPMCSDGVNDMFEKSPWDLNKYSDDCWAKWKVRPQPYLAEKIYGGKRIESASNIVFSNGLLDPWTSGGVLKTKSESLVTVLIPDGAHHLDLRGSNKADPSSVRQARLMHQKYINMWINETQV